MDVTVDIAVGKERYGDNSSLKKDIDVGSKKHKINGNDHVNENGKDETNILIHVFSFHLPDFHKSIKQ